MDEITCPRCQVNDASDMHECPFDCEIRDNCEACCTCCSECAHECAEDI